MSFLQIHQEPTALHRSAQDAVLILLYIILFLIKNGKCKLKIFLQKRRCRFYGKWLNFVESEMVKFWLKIPMVK